MALREAYRNINTAMSFADAFGAPDITTPAMQDAIRQWYNLYFNRIDDEHRDFSQRIPCVIIDQFYKPTFAEYNYSIDESTAKGQKLKKMLDNFDEIRADVFQQACIGGMCFIKPVIVGDNFEFEYINRKNMVVFQRQRKRIMSMGTSEVSIRVEDDKAIYYTLMERRTVNNDGYLTIENKLYRSETSGVLGSQVPLTSVPEYAVLQPQHTLSQPVYGLGLIPVSMVLTNNVDESNEAVSIYAAAVDEILKLYRHEKRTDNEYELTEPHLIASDDILKRDRYGNAIEPPKYITAMLDATPAEAGMTIWNPKPNQVELEARELAISHRIEDLTSLRRGDISQAEEREMTATEIVSTTAKKANTIAALWSMWGGVMAELVRVCDVLARMYKVPGWDNSEPPEPVIEWGNGIIYDQDKEFGRLNLLSAQGNLRPEYLVGWQFDMPTDNEEDLAAIRDRYMPSVTAAEGDNV